MTDSQPIMPAPQNRQKSRGDVFNDFYTDAVARFPELKGRFIILDMNEYRTYGTGEVDCKKTGLTSQTALQYIGEHPITQGMKEKSLSSQSQDDPAHDLKLIFFNNRVDENEQGFVSEKDIAEMLFVLDHELAHRVIQNGDSNHNLYEEVAAESIADSYAMIRYYQRCGTAHGGTPAFDPLRRVTDMLFHSDRTHFTSFVLDEIALRKDIIDFNNLSAQQTARLAWRFAMEYTPAAPVIETLYATYAPVRKAYAASPAPDDWLTFLVDVVLTPQNGYYTFKAGSDLLMQCLKTSSWNGTPITLPAEYMNDALRRLKEMEVKFAQEEILFNMPTVTSSSALRNHPLKAGQKAR